MKHKPLLSIVLAATTSLWLPAACGGNPQITMTAQSTNTIKISMRGAGAVTIDWGDGKSDTCTLPENPEDFDSRHNFTHNYSTATTHIVTITGNRITGLDCYGNQLISLNVSKNTALESLNCDFNQLTFLNVSGCTALTELSCIGNKLTSLDVRGCTALIVLNCHTNQLASLDVSECTALAALNCYKNQLTSLDVSKNTVLEYLNCTYNDQLSSFVPNKHLKLEEIDSNHTKLPQYPYIYVDAKTGKVRAIQKKLEDVFWVDEELISEKMYQHFLRDINEFAQSANNKDITAVVYCWSPSGQMPGGMAQLRFMKGVSGEDYYEGKGLNETDDELWKDVWKALDELYRGDGTGSEYRLKRSIGCAKKIFAKYDEDKPMVPIAPIEIRCAGTVLERLLKENAFDKLNKTEDFEISTIAENEDDFEDEAEYARELNNK